MFLKPLIRMTNVNRSSNFVWHFLLEVKCIICLSLSLAVTHLHACVGAFSLQSCLELRVWRNDRGMVSSRSLVNPAGLQKNISRASQQNTSNAKYK